MTTTLSLKDFWEQCSDQTALNPRERITWFPQQLGEGYFYGVSLRPS